MIDCALVVSDLHVLSTFAVLRPGFKTAEGNEIGLNRLQEWLWLQMQDLLAEVDTLAAGRKFCLILNGDLIDGNHHRTIEILACEEIEHAKAAIYTLEPLVERAGRIFITEGTESHTKGFEDFIGKSIGAEPDTTTGRHVFKELNITIHGSRGNVRHHMPTTSRVYLSASQLSIQLGNAQLAASRIGHQPPQWICAGHRHTPGIFTDGNAMFVVTPAWQGLTRYARKVVPDGKITPGFVWLDWKDKTYGSLPHAQLLIRNPEPDPSIELS